MLPLVRLPVRLPVVWGAPLLLASLCAAEPSAERNTCRVVDLAIETDGQFLLRYAEGDRFLAERYLTALVEQASMITAASLDLRLRISSMRLGSITERVRARDAAVPAMAEAMLEECRARWEAADEAGSSPERDLVVFFSGAPLDGLAAYEGGLCSDRGYAVLTDLVGIAPQPPVDGDPANRDLIQLLRAVAIACGASPTDECDPAACGDASAPSRGSIMSLCDACPEGFAAIDLRFDDRTIGTIWESLGTIVNDPTRCRLGGEESGLVAMPDRLHLVGGTVVELPLLANDDRTNCGPIELAEIDRATRAGLPLSRVRDAEGIERIYVFVPRGLVGFDRCAYRITDVHEASALGDATVLYRNADLTGDDQVDGADLEVLLEAWGSRDRVGAEGLPERVRFECDLDGDGRVGARDLGALLQLWGPLQPVATPPAARP